MNSNKPNKLIYKLIGLLIPCGGAVLAIIGFVLVFNNSTNTFGAVLALVGIILFTIGVQSSKDASNADLNKEIQQKVGCTFTEEGTLSITGRDPIIRKAVQIEEDYTAIVKDDPLKIHYGSATVGGVTTGGVYTTGGHKYIAGAEKSGKYKLTSNNKTIYQIQLSDQLYNSAKQSTIAKYLNEKKQIQVIEKVELTELERQLALHNYQQSGGMSLGNDVKKGYPSQEKCRKILDWLSGIN